MADLDEAGQFNTKSARHSCSPLVPFMRPIAWQANARRQLAFKQDNQFHFHLTRLIIAINTVDYQVPDCAGQKIRAHSSSGRWAPIRKLSDIT